MSLRVENLTKAFGEHLLFRQLRFTIDGPAVLWAPSGWGKTTPAADPDGAGTARQRTGRRGGAGWPPSFRRTASAPS